MSGSAIRLTEKPKINSTSRNMHMTGKEKMLAARPVHEERAAGGAVSDGASSVWGKVSLSTGLFF